MSAKKLEVNQDLVDLVLESQERGTPNSAIKKAITERTGWKKTKALDAFNEILKVINEQGGVRVLSPQEEKESIKKLEFSDRYVYNKESKKYVFLCKNVGKNIILPRFIVDGLIKAYSNYNHNESSLNELALKFNIPKAVLTEIFSILGISHDSLPITSETLEEKPEEKIVEELLQDKRFSLFQKLQKVDWQQTQDAAFKWWQFETNIVRPIQSFLTTWKAPEYKKVPAPSVDETYKRHLLINIADLHVGLFAEARYLFRGEEWDVKKTQKVVTDYAAKIKQEIENRKYKFDSCVVCLGGDILHTITGFTDKGTKLEAHPIGETQLDLAFNMLVTFTNEMLSMFPKVSVKSVPGNHSSFGDYVVSKILQTYYKNEKRLDFEISTSRYLGFKLLSSLFILEHGYAAFAKGFGARLPKGEKIREAYIQDIFLSKPTLLQGIKQKYFLTNDQHHLEIQEKNQYEMIMCGTPIGGDRHSDQCNLSSRKRQNAFVVDKDGIKEIWHIYFD